MAANSKHYLPSGKVYTGPTHRMNGKIHSGSTHTASSKILTHSVAKKKDKK